MSVGLSVEPTPSNVLQRQISKTTPEKNFIQQSLAYLRVSTGRQIESELSIPDQRRQIDSWCRARGCTIVGEFVDGTSATDDKRLEFQRMIDRATDGENSVDAIVVHSYSRFFRDAFELELYVRKLRKHGVRLISISQELNDDDPSHGMARKMMNLFDEYQSKENAKHVVRSMKESARQGWWNGARPPYGYRTIAVEQRGARVKKKLEIDVVEAETVKLIFRLAVEGDCGAGPMGVKSITVWLNEHGYRTRAGSNWGIGTIHTLLTDPVYSGIAHFNRTDSPTGTRKAASEHVTAPSPIIIDPPLFQRAQSLLKSRNPRVTPPRGSTGPILLTGLSVCATCGGAMTLRTGTGKSGKIHRYYACSTSARKGKTACNGRAI